MADTNSGATGRASPRQYPPELKRRAIRLVLESLDRGDERQGLVTRTENRELRRANEILKSASAFFAAELDRPQRR
jgi:transposase-like protein